MFIGQLQPSVIQGHNWSLPILETYRSSDIDASYVPFEINTFFSNLHNSIPDRSGVYSQYQFIIAAVYAEYTLPTD